MVVASLVGARGCVVEMMVIRDTRMGEGPWKDSASVMPTVVTSTKAYAGFSVDISVWRTWVDGGSRVRSRRTNLPAKRILWVKVAKVRHRGAYPLARVTRILTHNARSVTSR